MVQAFTISRERYRYLLPVLRSKLLCRHTRYGEEYSFIGTLEDREDMLRRCRYL